MKIIRWIVVLFFALCVLVSGTLLYRYYDQARRAEESVEALRAQLSPATPRPSPTAAPEQAGDAPQPTATPEPVYELQERFAALYAENSELAGWIKVEGTTIDYPVMLSQGEPDKYLYYDFDGNASNAGMPYLDSRCSIQPNSEHLILYGHNMKSRRMFHDLVDYKDESFWEAHKYVLFDTLYFDGTYEVVAAYLFDVASAGEDDFQFHRYVEFADEEEFDDYMAEVDARKLYDTGVTAQYGDELLTLATCEYSTYDSRFVLLTRRVA